MRGNPIDLSRHEEILVDLDLTKTNPYVFYDYFDLKVDKIEMIALMFLSPLSLKHESR